MNNYNVAERINSKVNASLSQHCSLNVSIFCHLLLFIAIPVSNSALSATSTQSVTVKSSAVVVVTAYAWPLDACTPINKADNIC